MKTGHTPGRWFWNLNLKSKCIHLEAHVPGFETVMDFVRWGMGGAQPRFKTDLGHGCGVMRPAQAFAEIVPGREHHASWFQALNHPDARLIAAAPELLAALKEMVEKGEGCLVPDQCGPDCCRYGRAKAALAKATGDAP